jgi:hypothetical protein
MATVAIHSRSRDGAQSRSRWLAQTLDRVDYELARDEAQGESPFIVHGLVEFRDYLEGQLHQAAAESRCPSGSKRGA